MRVAFPRKFGNAFFVPGNVLPRVVIGQDIDFALKNYMSSHVLLLEVVDLNNNKYLLEGMALKDIKSHGKGAFYWDDIAAAPLNRYDRRLIEKERKAARKGKRR